MYCGDTLAACGNTIDDDRDGLVDLDDPDCLSPCDDDEAVFSHNFNLDAQGPDLNDCYWDDNPGDLDDTCRRYLQCDPESPGAPWFPYEPGLRVCGFDDVGPSCVENCLPLAPNGCDCFGCCEVAGATIYLGFQAPEALGAPCAAEALEMCTSCTIVEECFNPCDRPGCELCFLDAPEDLAPGCAEPACEAGVDSCVSSYDCPEATVCLGGCCLEFSVGG